MAKLTLTNAYVSVASNDISTDATSVSIDYTTELQDADAMGNTSKARLAGLKDWSLSIEFNNDFASSAIDSIIFPLVGTEVAVELRPTTGAVSTSNPKFTGSGIISDYNPFSNAVGETARSTINIQCSDGNALARATS